MTTITYDIVEHEGGWAYRVGATYSETFSTHAAALAAAHVAATEQQQPGQAERIVFEDRDGVWRAESSDGDDRPRTHVRDSPEGPT